MLASSIGYCFSSIWRPFACDALTGRDICFQTHLHMRSLRDGRERMAR